MFTYVLRPSINVNLRAEKLLGQHMVTPIAADRRRRCCLDKSWRLGSELSLFVLRTSTFCRQTNILQNLENARMYKGLTNKGRNFLKSN